MEKHIVKRNDLDGIIKIVEVVSSQGKSIVAKVDINCNKVTFKVTDGKQNITKYNLDDAVIEYNKL